MGKDWKSYKSGELVVPSHSEPLWWKKIGKVANQVNWLFLVILSNFSGKSSESGKIGHSKSF